MTRLRLRWRPDKGETMEGRDPKPARTEEPRGRLRRAWILAIAALATAIVLAAVPASGHVGGSVKHLWKQHIKPRVMNLAYTKEQADARFLQGIIYKEAEKTTAADTNDAIQVYCPTGTRAISGGSYLANGPINGLLFFGDQPLLSGSSLRAQPVGWEDSVTNKTGSEVIWAVYVLCAS